MKYLQATGNTEGAKSQTNPKDEFTGLRRKFLSFIEELPLYDDNNESSTLLRNSFASIMSAEDAVEIILAESLQVCICIEMYNVLV